MALELVAFDVGEVLVDEGPACGANGPTGSVSRI